MKEKLEKGIDFIGVGVGAICHDGEGRIFLNKRGEKCRDEWGRWDNCGGGVKFGEDPETAMKRELFEEYGCKPMKWCFGGVVNAVREQGGKGSHWLVLTYLVRVNPDEVKIMEPEKLVAGKWFDLEELKAMKTEELHSFFWADFESVKEAWEEYYCSCSSTDRTAAS